MKNRGFTLVELLVVIGLISAVGVIIVSAVTSVLRGTNKGGLENEIRQEGNLILFSMTRQVQSAQSLTGANASNSPSASPNPTTCSVNDSTHYNSVWITDVNNNSIRIGCPYSTGDQTNSFTSLNTSLIKVSSCYLICSKNNDADSPNIEFLFTLQQKSTSTFAEQKASIDFDTTARMRNPSE